MLIAILEDSVFRKGSRDAYNRRWTVRAFARNAEGKFAFLRIKGTDVLGKRNHLETIGGGVENEETLEEALVREIQEEIGYSCEIEGKIGYVVDHYNALNRETISTFFLVKLKDYVGGENLGEEEARLIDSVEYIELDKVVESLSVYEKRTINELVQKRDRIAFEYYLKHIDRFK